MLLRRRKASTARFRILVHTADIVWPRSSRYLGRSKSPFILFLFRADGGSYRWGLWET